MKKLLFLLLATLALFGCGNLKDNAIQDENQEEQERETELSNSYALIMLEQMTMKYLTVDFYNDTAEKKQKHINEAITDVRLASHELKDDFDEDSPIVKDLIKLSETIEKSLNNLLIDEGSAYDDSVNVGKMVGNISREYLEGELPNTMKTVTGIENAND